MIVFDSSVILASAFGEPGKLDLDEIIADGALSSVNFGEIVTKLLERRIPETEAKKFARQFEEITYPLSMEQGRQAGLWRPQTRHLGLSLGDRCCLALGLELGAEVYTAERKWAALDLGVKVRVIR